ncbi:hypothetical protein EV175_005654 [Coemansia sp. RSA 1933]|nr:hypothetical protein EV175_005654 [Coemansia sp. RSA 1933]
MSITKAVITPLVLQLPTGTVIQSMLQLPTGIVSPKFPVSVAVSPNETNISSFVPYLMTLTPRTGDNSIELDAQPSSESTTTRIKRSISTIVRRSTSILRKSESTSSHSSGSTRRSSNDNTQLVVPTPKASPISRISTILSRRKSTGVTSSSPIATGLQSPPAPSYQDKSVLAAALSASYFNMVYSNGIVSPLIRGSMVHIKAVLDANTIVVVPMMRSEVFARARERIITKFFQGGVPLVESKRRKFVVCGENGHSLVIDNNPTWRRTFL